jgi:hypothetical protein
MKYKFIFLGIVLFLNSCINQKVPQNDVFNPVKEYEISSNFSFERYFINNSDTTQLEAWYLTEKNAEFNLIYFSGNSSNIRSAIPFFNELSEQFNLNIFSFNYSGYGLSEGEPSIDGIITDGKSALNFYNETIRVKNIPTILIGYSLGGFVALNVIDYDFVDQGILMSTFTSLKELEKYLLKEALPGAIRPFLKLDIDESIYDLDNSTLIVNNKKPILFIHGEKDDFIPPSMSQILYGLSPSVIKDIKIIDSADHRMVLKDPESSKKVISEIKKFISL